MSSFTKVIKLAVDIIEIWIPVLALIVLLMSFLIGILFRYLLDNPLIWPYEITMIAFMLITFLGASFALRDREHIEFTLFYQWLSPSNQRRLFQFTRVLIIMIFLLIWYPSYDFISFMSYKKTTALNIPYPWFYYSFLVFISLIIIRLLIQLTRSITNSTNNSDSPEGEH